MLWSVVVLVSLGYSFAEGPLWTPPAKPKLMGENYWVQEVDLIRHTIVVQNGTNHTPAEIVEASIPGFLGPKGGIKWNTFNLKWFSDMKKSFLLRKPQGPADISQFLTTGKSHGMPLRMNMFSGAYNWNYGTHVHRTLEYMTVLQGTLYEHRSDGHVDHFDGENEPLPDGGAFHDEITKTGSREINEFGSLHTSYTKDDGVLFLTLYNGDWFFGIDGCQNPKFICTPNGCDKSPKNRTIAEICKKDSTILI